MNKNLIVGLLAVLALGTSLVSLSRPAKVINQTTQVSQPTQLGAVTNPDIPSPYLSWVNVRDWRYSQPFQQGTTTICAIPVAIASSTLVYAAATPTIGTSTAIIFTATKSTTAFSTSTNSTILATSTLAASAQGVFIIATTTPVADSANGRATLTDRNFVGSSTPSFLNVSVTGGQGGFNLTGRCEAVFREL
jgi:hypothetical protein